MKKYFIHDGKDQHGPFTIEELKLKGINSKSMIWFEGLTTWTEAQFIPELKEFIVATPPPFEKKNSINQTFDKAKKAIDKDYVNEIENKIPTKTGKKVFKYILLFFAICGFIMLVFSLNPSEEKKEENNPELFLEFSDLKIENSGYFGLPPSWRLTGKVTNKARYVTYKDLKFEVEFYTRSKKPIGKIEINDYSIFTPSIDIDESKYSKYYYIDIEIDQEIPKEIDAKNSIVKLVGADIAEKEKASQ
jgi:hypothetical protein